MRNTLNLNVLTCLIILLGNCAQNSTQVVGGSSDTEISASIVVKGIVVDSLGLPVSGTTIRLRSTDTNETLAIITRDTLSNATGVYSFSSLRPGAYSIELNRHDSLALAYRFELFATDSIRVRSADTIRPMATLTGTLLPDSAGFPTIFIFGLSRIITPDSLGRFSVRVPYGSSRIRFAFSHGEHISEVHIPNLKPGAAQEIGFVIPPFASFNVGQLCSDSLCERIAVLAAFREMGLDTALFDSIAVFKAGHVRELNLRKRKISFLSKELFKLPMLSVLDISSNMFFWDPFEIISRFTNLSALYLDNCSIIFLPQEISNLKHLAILDLSNNELFSLPLSIVSLSPSKLNLANNRLRDLTGSQAEWATTFDPMWQQSQRSAPPNQQIPYKTGYSGPMYSDLPAH